MQKYAAGVALALVVTAAACGGTSKPAAAPFEDDLAVTDNTVDAPVAEAARVTAPTGTTLIAGHKNARYEFTVPPGLARLTGVALQEGDDPRELSLAGPDGVGIPDPSPFALDGVLVFSDPLGLGVDLTAVTPEARAAIVSKYTEFIQERFPSASPPRYMKIGSHMAFRYELPRVEMPDRPVRAGRHYLVLDGIVTVSVDCLWREANAAPMSTACDAVAASLRPHSN
jgi:hypothetical protein